MVKSVKNNIEFFPESQTAPQKETAFLKDSRRPLPRIPLPDSYRIEFIRPSLVELLLPPGCIRAFKSIYDVINFLKSYFFPPKKILVTPARPVQLNPLLPKDALVILGIPVSNLDPELLKRIEKSPPLQGSLGLGNLLETSSDLDGLFKKLEFPGKNPSGFLRERPVRSLYSQLKTQLAKTFNDDQYIKRFERIKEWPKRGNVQKGLIESDQKIFKEALQAQETLLAFLKQL